MLTKAVLLCGNYLIIFNIPNRVSVLTLNQVTRVPFFQLCYAFHKLAKVDTADDS